MAKQLVTYFSATGTTKKVAEIIAKQIHGDLYEITPKVPYTSMDLDWMDKQSRSSVEMDDKSSRPEIVKQDLDVQAYDEIILGFPIWWYVAPTIVNTFLESYDFSGKKITVFATSEESKLGDTVKELQVSAPESNMVEGMVFHQVDEKAILDWVNGLYEM